jgi:hypothetical protein
VKYSKNIPFIQTYTGKIVYLFEPKSEDIDIVDIAHALALQCRYGGNCRTFYSVAEHSVRMSRIMFDVMPHLALTALLHDASEAYVQDVVQPMKHAMNAVGSRFYVFAEAAYEKLISEVFDLYYPVPEEIKLLDRMMGATERRDLHDSQEHDWNLDTKPLSTRIDPWAWQTAERAFLLEYQRLDVAKKEEATA